MIQPTAGRIALKKRAALIVAIALLLANLPALAAPAVRVTLRAAITLGLLPHNNTAKLSAAVKAAEGSTPAVAWKISKGGAVATVDEDGNLTARRKGAAVVYATAGKATARCVVTVRSLPVRALTLNKKKLTLYAKRAGFALTSKTTPANADNPKVAWSSTKPSVAAVDKWTGFVTPLKPGTAVIQCRATDGTGKKSYCTVVVKAVKPSKLTLSAAKLEVNVGATASLAATVSPADATDQRVSWYSSNPAVASVKGGAVTARKFGKATITAKTRTGSVRARCAVSVGYYTTTFRALVIGQSDYADDDYDLDGPQNDAGMVNSMLVNSNFGGGKRVSVTLKENLTASGMRSALNRMASWGVDPDDVTYFYYSGHGDYDGSLVGTDGNLVTVDQVRERLDKLPGTVVVMIDSCFSGWFIRNKSAGGGARRSVDPDAITGRVVSAFSDPGKGSALNAKTSLAASTEAKGKYRILVSSASTEESYLYPYRDYSLFTYHLAAGGGVQPANWEKDGLRADANRDKIVTLDELYRYTRAKVAGNIPLKRAGVKQSVRVWPAGSSFPVVQRTP